MRPLKQRRPEQPQYRLEIGEGQVITPEQNPEEWELYIGEGELDEPSRRALEELQRLRR